MTIDINSLKDDLKSELLGAYFGGGYGAALIEASDLDRMSSEQLVKMAQDNGIDLRKYII